LTPLLGKSSKRFDKGGRSLILIRRQASRRRALRLIGKRFSATTFVAIAVVALGVAGCGGSGNSTSTVTSTVTVPSNTASSSATNYVGTTSQGLPVTIVATSNAVLEFSFGWRANCADGQVRSNSIRIGGAPIRNGSFSFDSVLETGGVAQVEGKIEGDTASGGLSRSKGTAFGINCAVSGVDWQASAGSG
jgi:hypothetical protein